MDGRTDCTGEGREGKGRSRPPSVRPSGGGARSGVAFQMIDDEERKGREEEEGRMNERRGRKEGRPQGRKEGGRGGGEFPGGKGTACRGILTIPAAASVS